MKYKNESINKMIEFHYKNPLIWQLFKKYTNEKIMKGFEKYSAEAILNRVRWDADIDTTGSLYKIPNRMKPFYSRLYTNKKPKYKDFFIQNKSVCNEINFDFVYEKM